MYHDKGFFFCLGDPVQYIYSDLPANISDFITTCVIDSH